MTYSTAEDRDPYGSHVIIFLKGFVYGYINKKYHVYCWPSELLWYFSAIRKTLKETEWEMWIPWEATHLGC